MMLTFEFNQLVYYIIYSWRSVTGGEDGLVGIRRPILELPFVGWDRSVSTTTEAFTDLWPFSSLPR